MKVDITFEKDEHPACFGRECEGEHWQDNIHLRIKGFTLVLLEGTTGYKLMKQVLIDFSNQIKDRGITVIKTESECKCGEKFYIQKMLTDLEKGMMKCKHDGKPTTF